jgi:hypothetical protein
MRVSPAQDVHDVEDGVAHFRDVRQLSGSQVRSIKNTNVRELQHDFAFVNRTRSIAGGRRGMVSRGIFGFSINGDFFNTSYLGDTITRDRRD